MKSERSIRHVGQIVYITRMICPDSQWLSIPPGQSAEYAEPYLPELHTRLGL